MITGHTPTFRLMRSSTDGRKFTAKIACDIGLRDIKIQTVKQDALLTRKKPFECGLRPIGACAHAPAVSRKREFGMRKLECGKRIEGP